ncbi:MAG: prepilin peptidase [Candidatus Margulisiibacteriota bacterium]
MLVNIFIFIIGAVIGSFLNVLIHRLPREESIVFPSSHCPKCNVPIKWYDNIPIISYLLLRGRCRNCRAPISIRYPIVELFTALSFVVIYSLLGLRIWDLGFYAYAFYVSTMLVAIFADLENEIIPDEIIFFGIPAGLLWHWFSGDLTASIIGCALGFSLLFLISQFGRLIFKKEALGYGDLKLAALMGAWLLPDKLILALFIGYLLGAVWSLGLLALKIKKMDDYIPFGPWLCLGAVISFFFGREIIAFYLAHFF